MKFYIRFAILTFVFLIANTSSARILSKDNFIIPSDFRFTESLVYRGTFVPDVKYLQNILNMNTETEIKIDRWDNSGSNRNLTDRFGSRTKSALSRFHSVYAKDIYEEYKSINPNATSTTFVPNPNVLDYYTRAVLNKLIVKYSGKDDVATTTATTTVIEKDKDKNNLEVLAALAAVGGIIASNNNSSSNSSSNTSSAQSASGLLPFGGISMYMVTCTCSANLLLYVQDPRGTTLPLIYQPGATKLWSMGNITTNVNLLGQYTPGGVCLIYVGTGCSSGGTPIGTMVQVGTSLTI